MSLPLSANIIFETWSTTPSKQLCHVFEILEVYTESILVFHHGINKGQAGRLKLFCGLLLPKNVFLLQVA
jgi:hypothetical protein